MARFGKAEWRPIPVNYSSTGRTKPRLVVVHIMVGTLEGSEAWFHNPSAQASLGMGGGNPS